MKITKNMKLTKNRIYCDCDKALAPNINDTTLFGNFLYEIDLIKFVRQVNEYLDKLIEINGDVKLRTDKDLFFTVIYNFITRYLEGADYSDYAEKPKNAMKYMKHFKFNIAYLANPINGMNHYKFNHQNLCFQIASALLCEKVGFEYPISMMNAKVDREYQKELIDTIIGKKNKNIDKPRNNFKRKLKWIF